MPHMSSDQLRDISVAVVEDFINNKTPLSVGLAKQASMHELNYEQIQRCVEASNTIAHLKLLGAAEDRTFEFPLCKFAEVMGHAATPDIEKSAGVMDTVRKAGRSVVGTLKDVAGKGTAGNELRAAKEQLAAAEKRFKDVKATKGSTDKDQYFSNLSSSQADLKVAKTRSEAAGMAEEHARNVAGAKVTGAAVGATALGTTAYTVGASREKRASEDLGLSVSSHEAKVFFIKEAAANEAALSALQDRSEAVRDGLVKLAKAIKEDAHGLDKISCAVSEEYVSDITALVYGAPRAPRDFGAGKDGIFKQAELKAVVSIQDLYKEARAIVKEMNERKELHKRASAMKESLQKEAILGMAGRAIGSTIGAAAGTVAKGVKSIGNTVTQAGGKTLGIDKYKKVGLGATALTGAATLGMNSSMLGHSPGVNPVNGRSRDVWDGLQSN